MQHLQADDLLGMQLLMNPKKKASIDAMSVASSYVSKGSGKKVGNVQRKTSKAGSSSASSSANSQSDSDDDASVDDSSSMSDSVSVASSKKVPGKQKPKAPPAKTTKRSVASSVDDDDDSESLSSSTLSGLGRIQKQLSQEEILTMKREMLYQFDRLERKGLRIPKKFTMASSLDDMRAEHERLKRDRELDVSVQFQRRALMTAVSGVEFVNNRFDPFDVKLDGWADSINDNINDYDEIFEELHEKYKGKGKMAPEIKLLLTLGGSAIMFHLTKTMFSTLPGAEAVMRQNPDLARQFAAASINQSQQQQPQANGSNGLMGLVGSLFGGGGGNGDILGGLFGGGQQSPPHQQQQPPPQMRPPQLQPQPTRPMMRGPNMDDILGDMNIQAILNPSKQTSPRALDRIETLSTVSESELSELHDASSVRGVVVRDKAPSASGRRGAVTKVAVNKKATIDI